MGIVEVGEKFLSGSCELGCFFCFTFCFPLV